MAKSQKRTTSVPRNAKRKQNKNVVGSHGCNCCDGWSGPGPTVQVCIPVGGGGFICQHVAAPATGGKHYLTIEGGVIFWGQPVVQESVARGVMRYRVRPRKGK